MTESLSSTAAGHTSRQTYNLSGVTNHFCVTELAFIDSRVAKVGTAVQHCPRGNMMVQVGCVAVLVLAFLDVIVQAAENPDTSGSIDKRRGWGKRDSQSGEAFEEEKRRGWGKRSGQVVDALAEEDEDEMDKRRGWGKRDPIDALADMDKRRGWGKRSDFEEMDKRRGWGKRSDLDESEMDKRRGWGKRADSEMDKRRGWGKRAYFDEEGQEGEMDKRRGWGKRAAEQSVLEELQKRRGWGKRGIDKRRGWGKRSMDEQSCRELKNEVFVYVYKAVEVRDCTT